MNQPLRRCAIYTRKSSEEGLEQEFNSLHAQREACDAYVRSMKGEGWRLLDTPYDDGGMSGGSMERPGLRRLLDDIAAGLIDIVVVYKVDRLTRSLADFAKMVELFDEKGVSFVAVTQQFNTTSSMGRLTLNILLSFAQFEREVTGERIRDKIAASKRKGMWMGGNPPLGYDIHERKLVIVPDQAAIVLRIFERYRELGCVRLLKKELDGEGVQRKQRIATTGRVIGGGPLSWGALYRILSHPVYIGIVRHNGVDHPGQHEPIIPRELWSDVQSALAGNRAARKERPVNRGPSPLSGKLFDQQGERLVVSGSERNGRAYRYYVSANLLKGTGKTEGWRIPAAEIERVVAAAASNRLGDRPAILAVLSGQDLSPDTYNRVLQACDAEAKKLSQPRTWAASLAALVIRVNVSEGELRLTIDLGNLIASNEAGLVLTWLLPIQFRRRGQELRLIVPAKDKTRPVDAVLVKAIAKAWLWFEEVRTGKANLTEIARREGTSSGAISQRITLAFLDPKIVETILAGQQPVELSVTALMQRTELPIAWSEQRQLFCQA